MREIKFRAWDTLQGGKFEYWDSETNRFDGIFWTMIKHKSFKEPQQYTGLKDKNGKEVWEGDIIRIESGDSRCNTEATLVFWWNGQFVFKASDYQEHDYINFGWWVRSNEMNTSLKQIEVIGNIYENPELLKS